MADRYMKTYFHFWVIIDCKRTVYLVSVQITSEESVVEMYFFAVYDDTLN